MKKIGISLLLLIVSFTILSGVSVVNAANANVTTNLTPTVEGTDKYVTLTVHCDCDEGATSLLAEVEYDTERLTLESETIAENWQNYSNESLKYELLTTSEAPTQVDILTLKFKIKENVSGTANIIVKNIELGDKNNNTYDEIEDLNNPVTIENNNNDDDNTTEDNTTTNTTTDNTTQDNNSTIDNTTQQNETNTNTNTNTNTGNTSNGTKITNITNTTGKTDKTTSSTKLPAAGVKKGIMIFVAVLMIIAISSYVSYKKYKDIK